MSTDEFVNKNKELAYWTVHKTLGIAVGDPDYEDAGQVALMAMAYAYGKFDPTRKSKYDPTKTVAPSTYVVIAMQRSLRKWNDERRRRGFSGTSKIIRDGGNIETPLSLNVRYGSNEFRQGTLADEVADPRPELAEYIAERDDHIWKAMEKLPSRARFVIACTYWLGLTDFKIAKAMGVHKSRPEQIRKKALKEMHKHIRRLQA